MADDRSPSKRQSHTKLVVQALVDAITQPFWGDDAGEEPPADIVLKGGSEGFFDVTGHDLRKERAAPSKERPRRPEPKVEASNKLSDEEPQKEPVESARPLQTTSPASQVLSSKVTPIAQASSATMAPTSKVLSATAASTSEVSKSIVSRQGELKSIQSRPGDDLVGETCEMKARNGQWQPVLVTCRNTDGTYAVVLHGDLRTQFPSVAAKDLRDVSKDFKVSRAVPANRSSNGRSKAEVFGGRLVDRLPPGSSSKFRDLVDEIDASLGSVAEALPPNAMRQLQAAANERWNPILKGASPFTPAGAAGAKMTQTAI